MISVTAQYALRSLVHIANHPSRHTAEDIADTTGIPIGYLSKVLTTLGKAGLIAGQRGTGGGYSLLRRPEEVGFLEVVRLFDPRPRPAVCSSCCGASCKVAAFLQRMADASEEMLGATRLDAFRETCIGEAAVPSRPGSVRAVDPAQGAGRPAPHDAT